MTMPVSLRLSGRIALITGASRGIGAAVAKRFAAEGAQVILTARTVGGLEAVDDAIRAAGGLPATLIPLDLMELDRIDELGPAIWQRYQRLDIVVGNAGTVGSLAPIAASDPKIMHRVMTINTLANYRLIRATDPLLRQSDAGRALFVTDRSTAGVEPYWGFYSASKRALEAMVLSYAAEVTRPSLRVNLIEPGVVASGLRRKAFPGEDQTTLRQPESVTDGFVALAEPACTRHGELVVGE